MDVKKWRRSVDVKLDMGVLSAKDNVNFGHKKVEQVDEEIL